MNRQPEPTRRLLFKRTLLNGKIIVRTECEPGSITVLQDENGADLPAYESFFYEKPGKERIQIEFNQRPIELNDVIRIGFTDSIPIDLSIQDYLASSGYTAGEVTSIITSYELDKVTYLPCAHLPIGPQRIVLLLAALRSPHPAMVLRDPFMPFSGRWREHFARLLLENSREANRVIICTNLSFVPQTWTQDMMQYLDVGHAAEAARAQYRYDQEAKTGEQQDRGAPRHSESSLTPVSAGSPVIKPAAPPVDVENENSDGASYYLNSAYREVRDRIFSPLKEFSDFMRSYAAIVITGCMAVLIATMGIAFSPNLSLYQKKLQQLSTDPKIIYHSLISLGSSEPAPLVQSDSQTDQGTIEQRAEPESEATSSDLINPAFETTIPGEIEQLILDGERPLLRHLLDSSQLKELSPQLCQQINP